MDNIVEMRGIEKFFGRNHVLKKVDFTLKKGTIHALLGENGTGKTTLMNILGNILPRDGGWIKIDGHSVEENKSDHLQSKIAFIHQELSLVNDLTIYENLFLGRELKKGYLLDKKTMIDETKKILKRLNLNISPVALVRELNPSFKQITEIMRALIQNAKVIIMDEPTTSLTDIEIQQIFAMMRTLKNQGVSIIFISHKLNEVIDICDAYTVMRDGVVVDDGAITDAVTEASLSVAMVGKDLGTDEIYAPRNIGEKILEIKHLSREREYSDVSMHVCKGEIIGVTGLLGDGRSELFASVAGANYPYDGDVLIAGSVVKLKNTTIAKKHGISYVPKNRKENGIVKDLDIKENMVLPILSRLSNGPAINKGKVNQTVEAFTEKLNIKVSDTKNLIGSLSGGNQQKVVLAKALSMNPQVVILDNPTQGVDVGAKLEIYHQILALAKEGISFIVLSSEIPEIKNLCDRVYVMFHGKVKHEFMNHEINEKDVMLLSTGGCLQEESMWK